MARRPIDLAARINGNGAPRSTDALDFPVALKPLYYDADMTYEPVPGRLAVVREDTGEALAVVSDRYTLVRHQEILNALEQAIQGLDLGEAPRGIYLDRQGARLRALFKFPELRREVGPRDTVCPCVKVTNTYDGTSRVQVHIGAFRFVCTNLAVGGGGVFASGFMAVHQGEIPIEEVAKELARYLSGFDRVVELYRAWSHRPLLREPWKEMLEGFPKRPAKAIARAVEARAFPRVYDGYNAATYHATHRMRSANGAFDLLKRVNRAFQERFPVEEGQADPTQTGLVLEGAPSNGRRS